MKTLEQARQMIADWERDNQGQADCKHCTLLDIERLNEKYPHLLFSYRESAGSPRHTFSVDARDTQGAENA